MSQPDGYATMSMQCEEMACDHIERALCVDVFNDEDRDYQIKLLTIARDLMAAADWLSARSDNGETGS